jgi:hypothetical protein
MLQCLLPIQTEKTVLGILEDLWLNPMMPNIMHQPMLLLNPTPNSFQNPLTQEGDAFHDKVNWKSDLQIWGSPIRRLLVQILIWASNIGKVICLTKICLCGLHIIPQLDQEWGVTHKQMFDTWVWWIQYFPVLCGYSNFQRITGCSYLKKSEWNNHQSQLFQNP